jgi:chemotaxis protein methyltransferase CheR
MDPALIEQFSTSDGRVYTLKDFVKRTIHFQQFDLMNPSPHQNLDLILCRNFMIYFSKESQQEIHLKFYHSLKEGGYMITGKSEVLSGELTQKFSTVDNLARVYPRPKTIFA